MGGVAEQEASRRHFDRWNWLYSRSRVLGSLHRTALAELDARPGDRVLDVACGAGRVVAAVAPVVERAVGADLSASMIERARRESGADGAEFVVAPSDRLPFGDGEFTVVITTTAFHHFPDPAGSVREMARMLAPGGRLIVGDGVRDTLPSKLGDAFLKRFEAGHVGLQSRAGFERLLSGAGLAVTSSRPIWLGLYAFVRAAKPVR